VELFTGDGTVYRAVVTEASRSQLTLTVEGREPGRRECPVAVSIVVPVARGERMDTLVEKLSELGVAELWPVTTARSLVPAGRRAPAGEVSASRRERWGRIAIEAARQSGRATVLRIQEGQSLGRAAEALRSRFAGAGQPDAGARRGVGTPSLGPALQLVACVSGEPAPVAEVLGGHPLGDVAIFIGPEGDFDPAELAELTARGVRPVSLGPTVLRVETAAIVAAAAVVLWADAHVAQVRRAPAAAGGLRSLFAGADQPDAGSRTPTDEAEPR
jgi:16S rRNA (uracil1498-N3)-methyltransferase